MILVSTLVWAQVFIVVIRYILLYLTQLKKMTLLILRSLSQKRLLRKYEELYDELLDFYTAEELEQYREEYGD